jgi:uncharacterized membrane protein
MAIRAHENSLGAWAFLIGIILAVIAGVVTRGSADPVILIVIMTLGIIVGYFVSENNVQTFLFASVATVVASFAGIQGLATNVALTGIAVSGIEIGKIMVSVLTALLFLFVPSTIIVALKTVFSIAKL